MVFWVSPCPALHGQMVAATVMLALPLNTLLMSLVFYLVGERLDLNLKRARDASFHCSTLSNYTVDSCVFMF